MESGQLYLLYLQLCAASAQAGEPSFVQPSTRIVTKMQAVQNLWAFANRIMRLKRKPEG